MVTAALAVAAEFRHVEMIPSARLIRTRRLKFHVFRRPRYALGRAE